jgi:ribonuclease HII
MLKLSALYPGYVLENNDGYATKAHRSAIIADGPTAHHRRGFGELLRI